MNEQFNQFITLTKVDVAKREVYGTAAIEQPDRAGEIMDYEKSLPNFINWSREMEKNSGGKSLGNVREMHEARAVGKVIHFEPREETKSIHVGVKVVDDQAWRKVLEGVYTGFSVGGSYGEKWADGMDKMLTRYEAKPAEISLADVPCMPGATFEIVKADGSSELKKFANAADPEAKDEKKEGEDESDDTDVEEIPDEELEAMIAKLQTSKNPAAAQIAGDLQKAFPPAEKKDEEYANDSEKGDQEGKQDEEAKPEEGKEDQPTEEDKDGATDQKGLEEQAGKEPENAEGIKMVVIQLLEELGLVQRQGDEMRMVAPDADLQKVFSAGITKVLASNAALKKNFESVDRRNTELTGDLAKVTAALDEMEKRGGPAPVLREIGSLTTEGVANMQKVAILQSMIAKEVDPNLKQSLQNELATLQIKDIHSQNVTVK